MAVTVGGTSITFNDGTTQTSAATAAGLVTNANVLAAMAGTAVGAVGSFALLAIYNNTAYAYPGATYAGSALRYSATGGDLILTTTIPSGTWRLMGFSASGWSQGSYSTCTNVWLRIS